MALELMELGASAVLIGVGPGAACTTRGVLGIGVPQITSTVDAAAARDHFFKKTGRYVPVITDGGMRIGGEVCKAFAAGADADSCDHSNSITSSFVSMLLARILFSFSESSGIKSYKIS